MSQAAFGKVWKIQDVPSQGVTRIVVELPIEAFKKAVAVFHAMEVLVTLAPPEIGRDNPYGMLETSGQGDGNGAPSADRPGPGMVVAKLPVARSVGPRCARTVQWCASAAFQEWFAKAYPVQVEEAVGTIPATRADRAQAVTAMALKALLGIESRKELDSDPAVGREWDELVRVPWMAHQGLDSSNGD